MFSSRLRCSHDKFPKHPCEAVLTDEVSSGGGEVGTILGAAEVDLSTSSSPMIYSTSISYSYRILLSGSRNSKKGHRFKPSEGERESLAWREV